PIGNVTMLPLLFAYQFTNMLGEVPTLHPLGRKYEAKYCMFSWLTVFEPGPPTDHHCCGNTPAMNFSPRYPITPAGPICHLFCPSLVLVAVGNMKVGPPAISQLPTR